MTFSTSNLACRNVGSAAPLRFWSRASASCITSVSSKKLDERRKAEILQYNGNSAKLTKQQKYSNMVKGIGQGGKHVWASQSETATNPNIRGLPAAAAGVNTLLCSQNKRNCAPTTASDVPGKVKKLCMEENVPLTRHIIQRTYRAGGTKWKHLGWRRGDKGFPVGKAGRLRFG
jgi:hypothetical protein